MKQCVKLDGSSACSPSAEESAIIASIAQDGVQNGLQKAEKGEEWLWSMTYVLAAISGL